MDNFSGNCQNCGSPLRISELQCDSCDLTMRGAITLPRLAQLSAEDRNFIELFVLSAGSLKEVGKVLKLSYPTVRARLDRVIANLQTLEEDKKELRSQIIAALENGEISSEEALQKLNKL